MGPIEHQRKLDERFAVETALEEGVRMNRAANEQLERRTDELRERVTGLEKVVEEIIRSRRL